MHGAWPQSMQEKHDYWISAQPIHPEAVSVSIIIPAYNAAGTLSRALQSALDQTLRDIEVIVVDDASKDDTWNVITVWLQRDARLRAIRNKHNRGKSVGMNRAIALARGAWLAVLDADDWYERDRLATLLSVGKKWRADLVADNQFFYDGGADAVIGTAWPEGTHDWFLNFDDFLKGSNTYDTFNFGMLKPMVRKTFLENTGLTYEHRARNGQDFFYLLQFYLLGGRAVVTDRALYIYTQPFGAISQCWSHAGRRRYDFQAVYNVNQMHLATAAMTATPRQMRHLKRRNRRLRALENYYTAKDALQDRRVAAATSIFLRHPEILSYAFRRLLVRYFRHWTRPTAVRVARMCRQRAAQESLHISGVCYEARSPRY
jgi:succinoglycan biosynthesis protein ExoO